MREKVRVNRVYRSASPRQAAGIFLLTKGKDLITRVSYGKKESNPENGPAAIKSNNNPVEKGPCRIHSRGRPRLALNQRRGKRSSRPDETRLLRYSLARVVQ